MAKASGLGDQLYVDGNDLGGDINSLNAIRGGNSPLMMTDITQLANARLGGKRDGEFTCTSYFDPAALRSHASFSALPTTDRLASYGHGVVAGNAITNLIAKQINYDGNRADDGSFLLGVNAQSNSFGLEWCQQLTAGKLTQGAAGNVAGLDLGSASPGSFGGQLYYHLFAFAGTSVTLKIQHSNDNGSGDPYADVAGWTTTALVAAPASGRIAVTGLAIKQWLRVVSVGTFTNAQFLVSAVRNPVQTDF